MYCILLQAVQMILLSTKTSAELARCRTETSTTQVLVVSNITAKEFKAKFPQLKDAYQDIEQKSGQERFLPLARVIFLRAHG